MKKVKVREGNMDLEWSGLQDREATGEEFLGRSKGRNDL